MTAIEKAKQAIELHENRRNKPYLDSLGILTVGVGRNLDEVGLSDGEIDYMLDNDVSAAVKDLECFSWWDQLSDERQAVLIDMRFNLGLPRFMGFKKMLDAVAVHDYETAAVEMLDSKWARQVKTRATRLCEIMKTGVWPL